MTVTLAEAINANLVIQEYLDSVIAPVSFSDDFNRSNQNLEADGNWTRIGGTAGWATITSGVVKSNTTNTNGGTYACPDLESASQYVSAVFQSDSSPGFVCARLTNDANYIGMRYANNALEIYKKINGTFTIVTSLGTPRGSSVFRMEYLAGDNTVKVFKDGAAFISATSLGSLGSMPASSRAGLVVRAFATPLLDNFQAGALSG